MLVDFKRSQLEIGSVRKLPLISRMSIDFALIDRLWSCVPQYCVEVRDQLAGVGSPLLPRRFQGSNSGHQAWWQALLLTKSSYSLPKYFKLSLCEGYMGLTVYSYRHCIESPHQIQFILWKLRHNPKPWAGFVTDSLWVKHLKHRQEFTHFYPPSNTFQSGPVVFVFCICTSRRFELRFTACGYFWFSFKNPGTSMHLSQSI